MTTTNTTHDRIGSGGVGGHMFRNPVGFGPSPGPRQGPDGTPFAAATSKRTTSCSVVFETESDALERLLPPHFELSEPLVTVKAAVIADIAWLGGRSYNTFGAYFPVEHVGRARTPGSYCAVLWENLADPILTGREELGMAKLFADIDVEAGDASPAMVVSASWMGFRFATLEVRKTGIIAALPSPPPIFSYKYVPRSGDWGVADVEYATMISGDDPSLSFEAGWTAEGSVAFAPPEWQDMPTQAHIVRALAGLPQVTVRGGSVVRTVGGKDYADISILE
jgi:Acetoacetate decarboxylase (ADC)